ncbi:MAG: DUF4241 domain-containing protein [Roseburia sp.]|nr:DUF4241 domain-containing protein [Roseburia sp.]
MTAPIDFGAVLREHEACGVKLRYAELPFILCGSQRVVLFDAYSTAHKYDSFDVQFGVVAFPFYLNCMTDDGERVAYCGLRFGEERAVKWSFLRLDKTIGMLPVDPDAPAVAITSGVCCMADEKAYDDYFAALKRGEDPLAGQIVLDGQTHTAIEYNGNKYAVFSSGWGDGRYRCYVGYADSGKPIALFVDFGMIDYPQTDDEPEDVEVETSDHRMYVYDPSKSERENNIAQCTHIIETVTDETELLRAYSRRGYAYHAMNDLDAALSDYESAIEYSKKMVDSREILRAWSVYDNAAEIYCKRSDYESAIRLMNIALEVGDNFYAGAYVRLIDLYQLTKRNDDAKRIAERMLKNRPNDPVANMKYAECCVSSMDFKSAAEMYERLASAFKLYENLFDEALCLIELGEYDRADTVLERHPARENYEQYWYYKGYIAFKRKRYAEAYGYAQTSHDIDGEYMPALYLLIDIKMLMQDYHTVARYAEEYIRLRPDKEYGYSVCAEAQLILGNFSESMRNYSYLYNAIKQDDKYAAMTAVTASKTGDTKTSISMLRMLKRKKSPYYYGAAYAVYITKYKKHGVALSNAVYKLPDDFLLLLATYLTASGNILPATRTLEALSAKSEPTFETVALQIRSAVKMNDKKHFMSFLEYYVKNFIGDAPAEEKVTIAERFVGDIAARSSWVSEVKQRDLS